MSDETISMLTDENAKLRRANRLWKTVAVGALFVGVAFFALLVGGLGLVTATSMRGQAMRERDRAQMAAERARFQAQQLRVEQDQAAAGNDKPVRLWNADGSGDQPK